MGENGCKWKNIFNFTFENFLKKMASFIGDYICKIDAKGRIAFPSGLKKQLSEGEEHVFVLKKDIFEQCLVLYTQEEWQRQIDLLRQKINPYKKEHNQFYRAFHKDTAEIKLDTSSRLLIPRKLLDIISIDKEVYLAGQDRKIEIWNKETFEQQTSSDNELAELAEKIMGGEILEL